MKTCTKCSESKPVAEFYKNSRSRDGLYSWCKECKNAASKRLYEADKERILRRVKTYREDNRDAIRNRNRAYRSANKESVSQYHKSYRQTYNIVNKDRIKSERAKYYIDNRDHILERGRGYYQSHRDSHYKRTSRYRARRAEATQGWYSPTPRALMRLYGSACLVPGCDSTEPTVDHVIPISKGGSHGLWNMQPLCQSHNSSKGVGSDDYRVGTICIEMITIKKAPILNSFKIGDSSKWLICQTITRS